jgi:hypothetical protein
MMLAALATSRRWSAEGMAASVRRLTSSWARAPGSALTVPHACGAWPGSGRPSLLRMLCRACGSATKPSSSRLCPAASHLSAAVFACEAMADETSVRDVGCSAGVCDCELALSVVLLSAASAARCSA